MPTGRQKSRTFRRVFKKTPGARNILSYVLRKPKGPRCNCGKPLQGIPRLRASVRKTVAKSKKTNARPYGGNLCSACMRDKIKSNARNS